MTRETPCRFLGDATGDMQVSDHGETAPIHSCELRVVCKQTGPFEGLASCQSCELYTLPGHLPPQPHDPAEALGGVLPPMPDPV